MSGIFRVGLIFAEFATSLKSPKTDTAKNKPYYTSSMRVLEIAKIYIGLSTLRLNLAHIFAKISRREKFPIHVYGILSVQRICMLTTAAHCGAAEMTDKIIPVCV